MAIELPDWVQFPKDDWVQITAEEAGLDPEKFAAFIAGLKIKGASFGGEDHSGNKYGAVLTRDGYLVHAWGDRYYRHHTASVGKAFMWAILGLSIADGLIDPDEPINKYWTGAGQLSHPHKHLDQGHHKKGCFPPGLSEFRSFSRFFKEIDNFPLLRQSGKIINLLNHVFTTC